MLCNCVSEAAPLLSHCGTAAVSRSAQMPSSLPWWMRCGALCPHTNTHTSTHRSRCPWSPLWASLTKSCSICRKQPAPHSQAMLILCMPTLSLNIANIILCTGFAEGRRASQPSHVILSMPTLSLNIAQIILCTGFAEGRRASQPSHAGSLFRSSSGQCGE